MLLVLETRRTQQRKPTNRMIYDSDANRPKPTLICLTPVKNEAWILERFLAAASLWADHIVIADQGSVDGSRDIAQRFPKVTLIDNPSSAYDEGARQRLLIDAARTLPIRSGGDGRRLFLALDADEFLSANWLESIEWRSLLDAVPGTILGFKMANVLPDLKTAWLPSGEHPLGFVDDGSIHTGSKVHSDRVPTPQNAPELVLRDIKVLHYQYVTWARMKSEQRWYQCWARVHRSHKDPITVYRQAHIMDAIPPDQIKPLKAEWLEEYERQGIDLKRFEPEPYYHWDIETLALLVKHGAKTFRKLNIWDVDWMRIAEAAGKKVSPAAVRDPRTPSEKKVHNWLAATQPRRMDAKVRLMQKALRLRGW